MEYFKLKLISSVERDIRSAMSWHAKQDMDQSKAFITELEKAFHQIEKFPKGYPLFYFRKYRRVVLNKFPYIIIYLLKGDEIVVLAVAHQYYWLSEDKNGELRMG